MESSSSSSSSSVLSGLSGGRDAASNFRRFSESPCSSRGELFSNTNSESEISMNTKIAERVCSSELSAPYLRRGSSPLSLKLTKVSLFLSDVPLSTFVSVCRQKKCPNLRESNVCRKKWAAFVHKSSLSQVDGSFLS